MSQPRNLKLDLAALGLLALAVFLTVALASYDPTDPPTTLVFPAKTVVHNACGRWGALAAEMIFRAVGLGSYFAIASLAALDVLLLGRRKIGDPVLRAIGWGMTLAGISTFAAMALQSWAPGPVIGAGGYLGAAGRGLLEMNFASAGAYILTLCVIVSGLLLCTDYFVVHAAAFVFGLPALALVRVSQRQLGRRPKAKPDDLEHGPQTADSEPAIRVRGKRDAAAAASAVKTPKGTVSDDVAVAKVDDDAAENEDEDESADEHAVEPNAGKRGIGARLVANVPIKNLAKNAHLQVLAELEAASQPHENPDYELPPIDMLLVNDAEHHAEHEKEVRQKAKVLEKTFADFGFTIKVVEIETGPVIAQYEIELEAGLRLSKITSLAEDLAIALRVPSVRIVAPIPGKNTVGIEVPNANRQLVRLREVIEETQAQAKKMRIPIFLGKDVSGNPMVVDLATLPHLLIAGRTGTGKSVCLNSIILSMLMTRRPDEVRMLMIDPKMVELSPYKKLPHLMHPVVTDMRKAEAILAWAVEKMEERYSLLARAGVRHISIYNQLGEEELMDRLQPEDDEQQAQIPLNLPYIVIVADEIADMMMTAGKEVEQHIIRLAQKSRAVGIHLVLATQKPTVDVITGLIKSNLPARIAFQVASRVDSRVVLDEMGADKLLGNGDMLFLWPGTSTLLRGQGTYLSDDEITKVVDFVGTSEPQFVKELVQLKAAGADGEARAEQLKSRDELYEAAIDIVVREGRGSVSLLQRALGIGYGRAARLVDYMAEDGIVGEYAGSQAREVLVTAEQVAEMFGSEPAAESPKSNRNKIMPDRPLPLSLGEGRGEGSSSRAADSPDEDELHGELDDELPEDDEQDELDDGEELDDEIEDEDAEDVEFDDEDESEAEHDDELIHDATKSLKS